MYMYKAVWVSNDVLHRQIGIAHVKCLSFRKSDKRVAKARAAARHRTARSPRSQSGLQTGHLQSPLNLKVPCKSVAPLMNCAFPLRAQEVSAHNPAAAKLVEGRGDALFVLAALVWCGR